MFFRPHTTTRTLGKRGEGEDEEDWEREEQEEGDEEEAERAKGPFRNPDSTPIAGTLCSGIGSDS